MKLGSLEQPTQNPSHQTGQSGGKSPHKRHEQEPSGPSGSRDLVEMEQGSTRNKIVGSDGSNSKNHVWRIGGTAFHLHKAIVMIKQDGGCGAAAFKMSPNQAKLVAI